MTSNKKKTGARRGSAMPKDPPLIKAGLAYQAAIEKLYNILLKDNDGNVLATLGALSIFRLRVEQDMLDQIREQAREEHRRTDGGSNGREA